MFNPIRAFLGDRDIRMKKYEVYNKHTGEIVGVYDSRSEANSHQTDFAQRIRMVRT